MLQLLKNWIWRPRRGESAEEYVERVGGWKYSNMEMMRVLTSHFRLSAVDAKTMCMQSRSYWRAFFLEHIEEMFAANGSRFGAMNYIRRKNDPLGSGELLFTEEEIEQIVDSVGEWQK